MYGEEQNHTTFIYQRLQAQESLNEFHRQKRRQSIAALVRTIWHERTFLIRICALGLIGGVLLALLIPARYTATTRLMPPENQFGSSLAVTAASLAATRGTGGFSEIAGDLLGLKNTSDVFAGILNSRAVQNEIVERFDLKRTYGVSRMADARKILSKRVDVSIDRKNEMITVSVTDRDPRRAAQMAAAFTEKLNQLVSELSTSSARRERIFLEGRLAQVNQDLENAEQEFSRFSSKSGTIDIKEQGRAMLEVAGTLQGQLISAQSELEGLRQIYADSHVRVKTQRAKIAELQSKLAKLAGNGKSAVPGPDTQAADLYPSIRKLPLLGVTYADLFRRTKVQEAVYEVLTQEYELAKVQEAREIPNVKVLDPPEVPEKKDFPPRSLVVVSSAGVSLLGGVVVLFAAKNWSEREPDDLSKAIASEIWVDLKQKRFLNSANTASSKNDAETPNLIQSKRGILSFLGWNRIAHDRGARASSSSFGSRESSRPESSGSSKTQQLHRTA